MVFHQVNTATESEVVASLLTVVLLHRRLIFHPIIFGNDSADPSLREVGGLYHPEYYHAADAIDEATSSC